MLPITVMKSNVFQASLKKFCSPEEEKKVLDIHRAVRLAYTTVFESFFETDSILIRFSCLICYSKGFEETLKQLKGVCVCLCVNYAL